MRLLAAIVLSLSLLRPALAEDAKPATIPPPPPEKFGYPGDIGPSRGWYVWHKYDPATGIVDVSRDPPGEIWKAKVIPWCTTYRLLGYGAKPEELLPGERVNIFFNPDGNTKWGYVVHFQDEICQMRGHNHAWQIREVEPGDRWFRASLWAGNEKKLGDDEWSFWIDVDCEKWRDGKQVETFPLKLDDHVWMTWVWQNGQRVVKRIVDGPSCDVLKAQQERRTKQRVIDEGLPGIVKGVDGATVKLLLYSNGWAQARQFKPEQNVEIVPANPAHRPVLGFKGLTKKVEFGGTYGSGPTSIEMTIADPKNLPAVSEWKPGAEVSLKLVPSVPVDKVQLALLSAAHASPDPGKNRLTELEEDNLRGLLEVGDKELGAKMRAAFPELERAAVAHSRVNSLTLAAKEVHGTVEMTGAGPEWLRDLVGNNRMEVFDRVSVVDLYDKNIAPKSGQRNTAVDDAWIERLKDLPDVEYLELQSTGVTDAGMKTVGTLKSLKRLSITLLPVTGAGIKELAGLTELKRLSIASTKCTGEGFAALKPLTKLENLNFHSCNVNDAGLAEVGQLLTLERLEICHTKFTDAGTPHLAGLKNLRRLQIGSREATGAAMEPLAKLALRELDLHDGQASDIGLEHASKIGSLRVLRVYGPVTDASVKSLAKLDKLETLVINSGGVTDEGLKALHGLKRLTSVDLSGCKVTDDGVKELRAAIPKLVVKR